VAQDIDWPPYAYLAVPPEGPFSLAGIGYDVIKGMGALCNFDVSVVQTKWTNCWDSGKLGLGLLAGYYHACMTYTHTKGERNRVGEFSKSFLKDNKPAGILTRLVNGIPVVSSASTLKDVKIVDVKSWAPTADTLALITNQCAKKPFSGYTMISPTESGNDAAMQMLMSGAADAMWVYADQAYNYDCDLARGKGIVPSWNCSLWSGFGTKYAYIHTGLFGHAIAGTTLTLSKKGSGIANLVDGCMDKFLQTKEYYDICTKHKLATDCHSNSHFKTTPKSNVWDSKTTEQTGACSSGYCPC